VARSQVGLHNRSDSDRGFFSLTSSFIFLSINTTAQIYLTRSGPKYPPNVHHATSPDLLQPLHTFQVTHNLVVGGIITPDRDGVRSNGTEEFFRGFSCPRNYARGGAYSAIAPRGRLHSVVCWWNLNGFSGLWGSSQHIFFSSSHPVLYSTGTVHVQRVIRSHHTGLASRHNIKSPSKIIRCLSESVMS
jgi:hypothetical protein